MKIRINLSTEELEKIQAARAAKEAEAEVDAFMKQALENAVPWTIGLNDEDVAAYRAARAEAKRLEEKYGDCTPETLIAKLENMEAEMESIIKNRDEHQAEKQALKKKVSDLEHENLLLKGLLHDLCGSICGDSYDPNLADTDQTKAAFAKLTEVKSLISKLSELVQ